MGKTLGSIITIVAGAALTAIGNPLGPVLLAKGISDFATALLAPGLPKPDTTETAVKTSRPPRVGAYGESRLYGAYNFYDTNADGTAVDCFAVHDGELTEIVQLYLGDDKVTLTGNTVQAGDDGRYGDSKINIYWTDGTSPGAGVPALETLLPGIWDSDRRGDGVVLLAATFAPVKAKKFLDIYPNGTPTASMAAKWQKCPDPGAVDPTDETGWTWTENSIRQLLHYKLKRENVDYATKIAPTVEYWIAAADVCDQAIALKAGGTEDRYRSCVAHKLTDAHKLTTTAILATCDGWIAPRSDGALIVYAGEYYTPTLSIGPSEIIAFDWDGVGVDDDTAINEITCAYVSADHDYNSVDTDPWTDEVDIAERGQVLSDGLELQVPSHGQVRRLAKRKQSRNLAPHRGTVTTNAAGRGIRGERYINLLIEEAGATFFDGVAEITSLTRNIGTGGVTFTWIAANSDIDAWNPATEEGDPAPVGNRVAQDVLAAPVIDTAAATLADDGTSARIELNIDAPDREDLTWFIHWRLDGASIWGPDQEYSDVAAGAAVSLITGLVPLNALIEIEAAYQVGDGRVSPWSATETVDTTTSALAPSAPTSLVAADGVGQSVVTWHNPTSSNLSYTRLYKNTVNNFGTSTQVGGNQSGTLGADVSVTATGLAAGTWYFWVRSFNAAAVASATTGPDTATVT